MKKNAWWIQIKHIGTRTDRHFEAACVQLLYYYSDPLINILKTQILMSPPEEVRVQLLFRIYSTVNPLSSIPRGSLGHHSAVWVRSERAAVEDLADLLLAPRLMLLLAQKVCLPKFLRI